MFLSLRPRFATAILDGTKTAEVRRSRPRICEGALALLYAASPVREIVGTCLVDGLIQGSASHLWEEYGGRTGLSRQELREYLAGAQAPTLLLLRGAQSLAKPLPLSQIRATWTGFNPPQSYRFVPASMVDTLVR